MKGIASAFVIAITLCSLPLSHAGVVPFATRSLADANTGASMSAAGVSFVHKDCVGPGLGPLPAPHATHTQNVAGFVINARPVHFTTTTLTFFGAGPCPTGIEGPVLPQDLTGRYHFTAICRGVQNDGAIFIDVTYDVLAGQVTSATGTAGSCIGTLDQAFSVDLTVALAPYVLDGISIPPTGGVMLSITQ